MIRKAAGKAWDEKLTACNPDVERSLEIVYFAYKQGESASNPRHPPDIFLLDHEKIRTERISRGGSRRENQRRS